MPSQRRRIGFLPSEEVHEIIDKLCTANKFSQSKVTGLLVEEALRSRGVLSDSFSLKKDDFINFINTAFEEKKVFKNYKSSNKTDFYTIDKKLLSNDIKMMYEFIEFKYFKEIMKKNNNILD